MRPSRLKLLPVEHLPPDDLLKFVLDEALVDERDVRLALQKYATWSICDLLRYPDMYSRLRTSLAPVGFVGANFLDVEITDDNRAALGIGPGKLGLERAWAHWTFTRRALWCIGEVDGEARVYVVCSEQPGKRLGDNRLLPVQVTSHTLAVPNE